MRSKGPSTARPLLLPRRNDQVIVCHELDLVFIKTKKVGGTSFEIALSRYCGPDCIITPISKVDEQTRSALKFRGPQNYKHKGFRRLLSPNGKVFTKHMRAAEARSKLPPEIRDGYRWITIVRSPYDRAVSRYFWAKTCNRDEGLDFEAFYQRFPERLTENLRIAPLHGEDKLDVYLRYEHLQDDLEAAGLGFVGDTQKNIRAKSGHRPKSGGTAQEIFAAYPGAVRQIQDLCREEIEMFGYEAPV
ncbi:sulfotransferase family protein [Maritalea mobilis]|uniref:sulfotransferase family 2 domain-containing protein n=1 Tax=Maritalea mobilis TaxID=483324 RepID=UPI001C9842C3|nr:sulfotransferase family 2 domain-containing protein [Maritalea mobilis]MBY6202896.1 sulfotransferase family protein [Maritalea mobilis]